MPDAPGDNILVTGALGQIGTELVEALREAHGPESVIAADIRESEDHPSATNGPFITLDVLDNSSLTQVCFEQGIGEIYHLAALLSATGERNPELCRHVKNTGTTSNNKEERT